MLKSFVKRFIRNYGFDIQRYNPSLSTDAQLMMMLEKHKVNLIFDIGANVGQFGRQLRDAGYKGRIVSFEPLSTAREKLLSASQNDPLWEVAQQAAIGSENGETEIHVAGNSVSSSVLAMLDTHINAAPDSAPVGREKVPLRRLDTIALERLAPDSVLFMKIDTQGYEDNVLEGATRLLGEAVGLQIELSLVPLYQGQGLYDEMIAQLNANGFELWGLTSAFVDPSNGRLLQIDATLFRG